MSKVARPPSEAEGPAWETEDEDTAEGDLGYGLGRRPGGIYEAQVSHLFTSRKRSDGKNFSPPPFSRNKEERNRATFQYSKHKSVPDTYLEGTRISHRRRQSSTDSNSELSNVELRQHLHETLEEVEILKTELEASQRQLEGKEEALKILQSMAIFGKATSHTQAVLQKTVEQKRSLEKEINALQWEIEFDQNRFKNIEESWIQKYDRLNCENAVLKETLKLKTEEIKMLKSENAILNQQYLEALAMLDIKQQKMAQENTCRGRKLLLAAAFAGTVIRSQKLRREDTNLPHSHHLYAPVNYKLAVLGACVCHGPRGSPCACAKMAASTRKMLLQLKQELGLLQKSKEEAYIMADAFRIAFEQQLMRKNDQALRFTQMDKMCKKPTKWINWKHLKEDGLPSQSKKTLGQKLLNMLPSKSTDDQDDPQEVFQMLTDLLNDKEAALAHQRKVSYMLARALEDKDNMSKENKEKSPMKDNSPLRNRWQKTSEFPILCDCVHSSVQIFNSVNCICSVQHFHTDQSYTRTLKRSHSLPSNIRY
ncbi:coiled-coil domain-containing protein 125 isoform X1 [Camelus ferus]|uniref:Coiled-coil domain-containing protein 125 isoform X1 n=2 Tax=Camelus TaxID=9836 RepID=A0A8B8SH11_CAMFR|nr:coiled-coil domain-containing protein 125 isoform X1 [Camelus ferus]XP_032329506.1 coiled-coil domain-containing protein 125 isoform X1 [Camelus ferus]XP_032329508.1 coiled-coil domain-containing protein 125 isoform X1 [Camelus ferus]XP_032329515.1 coiled-coil domain-containing protein 125 isoform X1 [Camelus ferus]XP_032329522.1 coiled-coil domain-containing protein 125 isoform X1 [Camelus ferus]XP_045368349.1 coiled-coil domain-containing protein 125 isoform X1 [Camelus bactrianus]XP_045